MKLAPGEQARELTTLRDGSLLVKMRGITLEGDPLAYSYVIPAKDALGWLEQNDVASGTEYSALTSPADAAALDALVEEARGVITEHRRISLDVMETDRSERITELLERYDVLRDSISDYVAVLESATATDKGKS